MRYVQQIVKEILANPTVQAILLVNGIIGVSQKIWIVLNACRKFLYSVKEAAALGLFVILFIVAMIRSPQKLTEALLPPFALRLTYFLLIAAILGGLAAARTRRLAGRFQSSVLS